jgi:hypothetical protein
MRKLLVLVVLAALAVGVVPMAMAGNANQFAGCADEVGLEFGARFGVKQVNGLTMSFTAVGVDGFDPELTVLDQTGEVVACDNDSNDVAGVSVVLPNVEAGPSDTSAKVEVTVPGDQGRFDFEIVVTGADNTSGEFVLLYEGAEVFGATNVDDFSYTTTDLQAEAEVPFGVYAANLKRPDLAIDPEISVTFGDQSQTCSKSSSSALCQGEHEDLTDFTVTLDEEAGPIALNGDDVMLYYELGGGAAEFGISVGSYQQASFGAYTLIVYSGVVFPEAE